jgi:hypothetical protein
MASTKREKGVRPLKKQDITKKGVLAIENTVFQSFFCPIEHKEKS